FNTHVYSSSYILCLLLVLSIFFFFNDTSTTEIYTLSLHDALPIYSTENKFLVALSSNTPLLVSSIAIFASIPCASIAATDAHGIDRKSTRLNSSHVKISYAVFCLKKKKKKNKTNNNKKIKNYSIHT